MSRVIIFFLFICTLYPSMISAAGQSATFFIDNMDCCGSLESRISETLETMHGVIDFSTDAQSQTVLITYDDELTSLFEVITALKKEGFHPEDP